MFQHHQNPPAPPKRVVVLGAGGFVAAALIGHLARAGFSVKAIGRDKIDLAAPEAAAQLAAELEPGDALVFLSAITPDKGRGIDAFLANVRMGAAVCAAIEAKPPSQVVYFSTDAVYPFVEGQTSEATPTAPADLYGAAHLSREIMLKGTVKCPLAILRPTLIYGAGDTHNSYGANRFRRMARKEGKITLFGGGEEMRDHIYIDDVVLLIDLVLRHRSSGTLGLVTGRSIAFADLAKMVAAQFADPVEIVNLPRQMPVTYRHYDATELSRAFPDFRATPLEQGISIAHRSGD
ncbi:NAD(P)-dependent oxidoreductase [Pseudolabrys sp. FHR47]|uniref:NAD-dependent epimerase/dehydratase family protein n=1 Tax=Pseudolabrys sp. FHR47 TaxID=2562284 RepID=UPI0010BF45F7|nr:SDR family oxidoreductase [Pseudolabrys sp. FHR47]